VVINKTISLFTYGLLRLNYYLFFKHRTARLSDESNCVLELIVGESQTVALAVSSDSNAPAPEVVL